jgi:CRISPR/Cas system-associated exonuclease Cas4 (RecB family)
MLYLRYLSERYDIDRILFIYEFKANQDIKSFMVHYREATIEPIVRRARIVKEALDGGGSVKRPAWAEDDHKVCRACPYHNTCWGEHADS